MMEELGTVLRAVCLGVCICGIGIAGVVAVFLGFTGGGIITAIKDILGVGQRDEDELIDEAVSSIHQKRNMLRNKSTAIKGDGGIPDFDAAVAKYSGDSNMPSTTSDDSFSAQSLDFGKPGVGGLGSGKRFDTNKGSGGLRGKRSSRNDDYEIYDDGEDGFFE